MPTTTEKVGDNLYFHHYEGFLPTEEQMMLRGWEFQWMGAEGPYYFYKTYGSRGNDFREYHLQIVQQGPGNQSVINKNNDIEGYQNCCIVEATNEYKMLFFDTINNIEELDTACLKAGILNYK